MSTSLEPNEYFGYEMQGQIIEILTFSDGLLERNRVIS